MTEESQNELRKLTLASFTLTNSEAVHDDRETSLGSLPVHLSTRRARQRARNSNPRQHPVVVP